MYVCGVHNESSTGYNIVLLYCYNVCLRKPPKNSKYISKSPTHPKWRLVVVLINVVWCTCATVAANFLCSSVYTVGTRSSFCWGWAWISFLLLIRTWNKVQRYEMCLDCHDYVLYTFMCIFWECIAPYAGENLVNLKCLTILQFCPDTVYKEGAYWHVCNSANKQQSHGC